ncbi:MAG TPA: hypothetical protein ENN42_01445, partial [Thioalkalivibrio sp.]|nr:hypothetical protein [Thioalkalivibrio sp.]
MVVEILGARVSSGQVGGRLLHIPATSESVVRGRLVRDTRIAAAQFGNRTGDTHHNLAAMRRLVEKAVGLGAEAVSFHEGCVPADTLVRKLARDQVMALAEPVPEGPSTQALIEMARQFGVAMPAGLIERDANGRRFSSYVCVTRDGPAARHRKLHAFIHPHLSSGDSYTVFEPDGVTCGILTCFDTDLVENVRITTLLGAEVIFMPHVTCRLPSTMAGRGLVAPELWHHREHDPAPLTPEFMGPKGRGGLMRRLPASAWENGICAAFTNPVGMDDGQVRNGDAMVLDPHGEIITECSTVADDVAVARCTAEK